MERASVGPLLTFVFAPACGAPKPSRRVVSPELVALASDGSHRDLGRAQPGEGSEPRSRRGGAQRQASVAKLIDYGKFKYNEKIKAREARRNQSTAEIKEIRFRLKIDDHDFEVKKGHVVRFLNGGDKVKVTIMLRGREQSRPIGGVELLQRLAADVEEYGTVESRPKQEGRNIIMTLAPKGKKVHTQSEQRRRGDQSRAERQARQAARLAAKQEAQSQAAAASAAAIDDQDKTSETK